MGEGNISDTRAVLASIVTCLWGFKAVIRRILTKDTKFNNRTVHSNLALEKLAWGTDYYSNLENLSLQIFTPRI